MDYINYASAIQGVAKTDVKSEENLHVCIVKGLKDGAVTQTKKLLESISPLDVINKHIVPALNEIGTAFEQKKAYLPQLLMSAETASLSFEEVKKKIPKDP